MFDVVIVGGAVADGSGSPRVRSDVAIEGDTIAAIGDLSSAEASRVIDATGHLVAPGFIDTHAHSDGALLVDPQHANGLRQGITTEILGQDGLSYAPLSHDNYLISRWYLSGVYGLPPVDIDTTNTEAFLANYDGKTAVNVAYPVPLNAVRLETVGFRDMPLNGESLEKAKDLLRQAMEQGAVGLSTGLSFYPNSWSDTGEIIELCNVVAEYDGVYVTHLRDACPERGFGWGEIPPNSMNELEALEIGRRSGVKVHFSHFGPAADNALRNIDKAKRDGVDCTLECYPYPAGSGAPFVYMPAWANEGGPASLIERAQGPVPT